MTTLFDYTTSHFPHHDLQTESADHALTDHTAVAHVVGRAEGIELARRLQSQLPDAEVSAILVQPTDPTVVPDGGGPDGQYAKVWVLPA